MMEVRSSSPDRRRFKIGAALVVGGIAAGALIRAWLSAPGGPVSTGEVFQANLSPGSAGIWARLLTALSRSGTKTLDADQLVAAIARASGGRLGGFAREFMDDPELRDIWQEYSDGKRRGDVGRLTRRLSESTHFKALLNRYSGDDRFVSMIDALGHELGGTPDKGGMPAQAGAELSPPVGDRSPHAGMDRLGLLVRGPQPDADPVGRTPGVKETPQGPPVVVNLGGGTGNGAGGDPDTLQDKKEREQTLAGGETGEVEKLAKVKGAGEIRELSPWASLCFRPNGEISRADCAAINAHLGEDALWTACHKASLLDRCITLCGRLPELACADQAVAIKGCLERWPAQQCAEACNANPQCLPAGDPRQEQGDGVEPGAEPTTTMTVQELSGRLDSIWSAADGTEADQAVYDGVVGLVKNNFKPSTDDLRKFEERLTQIIQHSGDCGDACERVRTQRLIQDTFKNIAP